MSDISETVKRQWRKLPGDKIGRVLFVVLVVLVTWDLLSALYLQFTGDDVGAFVRGASAIPGLIVLAWLDLHNAIRRAALVNVLAVITSDVRFRRESDSA